MDNFITIIFAFYLGKYNDNICNFITNLIKKILNKSKNEYNDFFECKVNEKDFEKEGSVNDKKTDKKISWLNK